MSSIARASGIFASRSFSLYYAGQALSYIGDGLRTLAIPLLVYHLTGSALSLGVTYALEFLPFAAFQTVGGVIADRLDRRRVMLVCDFVRFSVMVFFAIAYARGILTLAELYAGIVIIATCAGFFVAGQGPSVSYMLGKKGAAPAIAALIAVEQGVNLVIPPVGAAVFALLGPLPALAVNAATYLASQGSLLLLNTLGPDAPIGAPRPHELFADIAEGFRIAMGDEAMRAVSWISGFLNFFGIMAFAVFIPFLERDLGTPVAQVGIAFGGIALGSVVGSLVAGRYGLHWPFGRSVRIAYLIDAIIFVPVCFAHTMWFAVIFFALASTCGAFEVAQIVAWRIRVAPEDKIGRVTAAVRMIALSGLVPGTLLGGLIADAYGARAAIWISTLGFVLIAFYAWAVPALRNETR